MTAAAGFGRAPGIGPIHHGRAMAVDIGTGVRRRIVRWLAPARERCGTEEDVRGKRRINMARAQGVRGHGVALRAQNCSVGGSGFHVMKVRAEGNKVTVWVNGTKVNEGKNCSVTKGAICLQSEGAEIQFRKVELTPLK